MPKARTRPQLTVVTGGGATEAIIAEREDRGIYVSPWGTVQGGKTLWATTRDGRRVALIDIPPGADDAEGDVTQSLWDILDRVDPWRPPLASC